MGSTTFVTCVTATAVVRTSAVRTVGLFAGVGGLELGLREAGLDVVALAENWAPAMHVLEQQFPHVPNLGDVAGVRDLPAHELLVAGFPCTDLSSAGLKAGIKGVRSGLVSEVLRLLESERPPWLLIENVPNLLNLQSGAAMELIVGAVEASGYRWAYRTVDARAFGLPQRRRRVLFLASNVGEPADLLFEEDAGEPPDTFWRTDAYGFYWTEGRGGLGWGIDCVPTLKGGSTIGIDSAPAVWLPGEPQGERLVMLPVEAGERLQGLPIDWTKPAESQRPNHRWKVIGNAVPVPVSVWLAGRLAEASRATPHHRTRNEFVTGSKWPSAAEGAGGHRFSVEVSEWPIDSRADYLHLSDLMRTVVAPPLTERATKGFLARLDASRLRLDKRFVRDVEGHLRSFRPKLPSRWRQADEPKKRGVQRVQPRHCPSEVQLRRELSRLGVRYRLHARISEVIPDRLDIVMGPARVAVVVRECFWHSCSEHGRVPNSDRDRWVEKLTAARSKDESIEAAVRAEGWKLIVVWEHDDPARSARAIRRIVDARRRQDG